MQMIYNEKNTKPVQNGSECLGAEAGGSNINAKCNSFFLVLCTTLIYQNSCTKSTRKIPKIVRKKAKCGSALAVTADCCSFRDISIKSIYFWDWNVKKKRLGYRPDFILMSTYDCGPLALCLFLLQRDRQLNSTPVVYRLRTLQQGGSNVGLSTTKEDGWEKGWKWCSCSNQHENAGSLGSRFSWGVSPQQRTAAPCGDSDGAVYRQLTLVTRCCIEGADQLRRDAHAHENSPLMFCSTEQWAWLSSVSPLLHCPTVNPLLYQGLEHCLILPQQPWESWCRESLSQSSLTDHLLLIQQPCGG